MSLLAALKRKLKLGAVGLGIERKRKIGKSEEERFVVSCLLSLYVFS